MKEEEFRYSYFFLPFRYVGDDYDAFKYRLNSEVWDVRPYILKDERNRATLADDERLFSGWGSPFYAHVNDVLSENSLYYTLKRGRFGKLEDPVCIEINGGFYPTPYRITQVSMVHFTSQVGFVILKCADTNPNGNEYTVAEMCSYMSRPAWIHMGEPGNNIPLMTCVRALFDRELTDRMLFQTHHSKFEDSRLAFLSFHYSDGEPGAFTTDPKQLNRMFMARYGYSGIAHRHPVGYEYDDYAEILALENYVNFGMSPSGLACLAYGCVNAAKGNEGYRDYLLGEFRWTFDTAVLSMYICLLHQKHMLLAALRSNAKESAAQMYRRVFQCSQLSDDVLISRLYSKTKKQLEIDSLAEDLEAKKPGNSLQEAIQNNREEEKKDRVSFLLAVNTVFAAVAALSAMADFLWFINSGNRKTLWIVILSCVLILCITVFTIVSAWDSIAEAAGKIAENKGSHKFIVVILLILIILLIFVAKWTQYT